MHMTIRAPLRVLAAAAVVLISVTAWGAGNEAPTPATAKQSVAGSIAKARVLLGKRRFNEALSVLRPLAGSRTVHANVLFLIGLAAIGASQQPGVSEKARDALLDAAITALRTMLVKQPGLVRVRLELARAFFLKGEDTLARRHFEQVLAGKPPAAVALNVNRFLNLIRARKRWSMRVAVALAPDSNIGAGSDERIIYIDVGGQSLPFRRNQEELTKSGVGISAWAGGEYQYPLDERVRLRAGADISRREYRENDFDQMTVAGHVGPRLLIDRDTEASLLASVRRHWTGNEPDHRDLGVRVEVGQRLSRQMTANVRASWHDRQYDERTNLDGSVMDVSLGGGFAFSPTVRANAGFGWGRERPKLERSRHTPPLGAVGGNGGLAVGVHVGCERHAAVDGLRGQLVSLHRGRLAPPGSDPQPARERVQPRLHHPGLQPAGLVGSGTAGQHRPAPRLRAHFRRAALRAPVLRSCRERPT